MGWNYTGKDIGITLFDACLKAGAPMSFRPGMRILEVGCCEEDWLEVAADAWPDCEFWGIDVNKRESTKPNVKVLRGDVVDPKHFATGFFDAVVSLSAIEHIGLGHYGDPKDENGDVKAVHNILAWLKPGGWFYFDVPYDPTGYSVRGTGCRIYDDAAIRERFEHVDWQTFASHYAPGDLLPKPKVKNPRYWYTAMVRTS